MAFFDLDFNNKATLPDIVFRSLIEQFTKQSTTIPQIMETLFSKNAGARRSLAQEDLMSNQGYPRLSVRHITLAGDESERAYRVRPTGPWALRRGEAQLGHIRYGQS
ncbi:hypothetical protein JB92DRAFT_3103899 [Gautieria morchelliformis]|nr:hypothetical protein JB92DRAFT_3103899 [Gautieria morchelliformis]